MATPRATFVAGSVVLTAIAGVVYVLTAARLLRPIADDYCFGASAGLGLVGSLSDWYATWSGDMFGIGVITVLVGMPLVSLPWALASMIAFVLAPLSVTAVMCILLTRASVSISSPRLRVFLAAAPVMFIAWWAYWWVPVTLGEPAMVPPANAVTFWQNINAGTVALMVLLMAWLGLDRSRSIPRPWTTAAAGGLGFLVGQSNPVVALSAVSMMIAFAWSGRLGQSEWRRARWRMVPMFTATSVAGAVVSQLAPGTAVRTGQMSPPLDPISPASLFAWTIPRAFQEVLASVLNGGTVTVALLGVAMALILRVGGVDVNARVLMHSAAWLVALALALASFARLGEAFSYEGFWHFIPTRVMVFVAAVLAGVAASTVLSTRWGRSAQVPQTMLSLAGLALAVSAILIMSSAIGSRHQAWEAGPAPVSGVVDIETPGSWVVQCWIELGQYRDLPVRETSLANGT